MYQHLILQMRKVSSKKETTADEVEAHEATAWLDQFISQYIQSRLVLYQQLQRNILKKTNTGSKLKSIIMF